MEIIQFFNRFLIDCLRTNVIVIVDFFTKKVLVYFVHLSKLKKFHKIVIVYDNRKNLQVSNKLRLRLLLYHAIHGSVDYN